MTRMPPGWEVAPLAEIATLGSGGTPQAKNPSYYGGEIPWAVIGDLNDGVVTRTQERITPTGLDNSSAKVVPVDTVLLAMYGSIGKLGITGEPMATNQAIATIKPTDRIDFRYLFYYLLARRRDLDAAGKGATQRNISQTVLKPWPVRFPSSLDEQRRIVDLLGDHLSRVDAAESYLDRAERRAEFLWTTALSELILPPEARDLLVSDPALLGADSPPTTDLTNGWRWARWANVGTIENGKPFPSSDYQNSGIRLLRPGNLRPQGVLAWGKANTRFMPESYRSTHSKSILHPGDLVMNLTAQSLKDDFLGRVCAVREGDESLLNQRIARLRSTEVDGDFALAVFRSRLFRHYVKSLGTGSLIQHMFTSQVNRFWIPVPPAAEQQRIVRDARDLESEISRQMDVIRLQGQRSARLRRSLLDAAFSGRLTAGSEFSRSPVVIAEAR